MDDAVAKHFMIDAVITVVDAVHGMAQLDHNEEARRQVGFADRLLLSKTDLADTESLSLLTARLTRMNPRAPILKVDFGRVPIAEVLDVHGFNLNEKLDIDPNFIADQDGTHKHDHSCAAGCNHDHSTHFHNSRHTEDIAAFTFNSERAFDSARLEEFLSAMIDVYGAQMLRYKGVLHIEGSDRKIVFQGVHQLLGSDVGSPWQEGERRSSKMVFIGKNLPRDTFILGLEQCLV